MNAIQAEQAAKQHSEVTRMLIRKTRDENGQTEKEVNDLFFNAMVRRGLTAPKAIMTKVRDTRRDFLLNRDEAECMAEALNIPAELLMPPATAQGELPIVKASTPLLPPAPIPAEPTAPSSPLNGHDALEQTAAQASDPASERRDPPIASGTGHAPMPETTPAATAETRRKIGFGIYDMDGGLGLVINMALTASQFERLTLAIPEYMMRTERQGDKIYCRANVPIFPYQAELIARAIYGGK